MKRKILAITLMLAMALMVLSGCSGDDSNNNNEDGDGTGDSVKIGIIAPTSGGVAVYGVASSNGTQMAFKEINDAGGINGMLIDGRLVDDKGDQTESVNAYQKLANNDNVSAIVGAVTSGPTIAVVNASKADAMPIVTPTATAPEVTLSADGNVFRACFLDSTQSRVMASYAAETLEAKTAAILYNSGDDYSSGLAQNFREQFEADGGTVVAYEAYTSEGNDYNAQITTIKTKTPDVLYLPDYYNTVALIIKQATDAGIEAAFLGADGWDGLFTAMEDISLANGSYYTAHYSVDDPDPAVQDFISNYKAEYGQEPNSFAALGYDSGKIMAAAIEKAGSTERAAILEALKSTDFSGVTGTISFDENGDSIKSITVIKIEDSATKLETKVDPN